MHAPQPMSTRSPMVGMSRWRSTRAIPIVVFWRIWTSSPIDRAWRMIPLWCQIRTRRPSRIVYGSEIPAAHSTNRYISR